MSQTISKRKWLFRGMQKLAQNRMVSRQKLPSICQGNVNHGIPHNQRHCRKPDRWTYRGHFPKSSSPSARPAPVLQQKM